MSVNIPIFVFYIAGGLVGVFVLQFFLRKVIRVIGMLFSEALNNMIREAVSNATPAPVGNVVAEPKPASDGTKIPGDEVDSKETFERVESAPDNVHFRDNQGTIYRKFIEFVKVVSRPESADSFDVGIRYGEAEYYMIDKRLPLTRVEYVEVEEEYNYISNIPDNVYFTDRQGTKYQKLSDAVKVINSSVSSNALPTNSEYGIDDYHMIERRTPLVPTK